MFLALFGQALIMGNHGEFSRIRHQKMVNPGLDRGSGFI
jgi:hypothetical protein